MTKAGNHMLKSVRQALAYAKGETAAWRVAEPEPAAPVLGFQDAILFLEIGDGLLLVTIDSAGDHGDQDVEDHSRSSG